MTESHQFLLRRTFLEQAGLGFGSLALIDLLLRENAPAAPVSAHHLPITGGLHFLGRARRVIQLFMNGGVSQIDTFDYKPSLERHAGQQVDFGIKATATGLPGPIMKSPFAFQRYGECGRWVEGAHLHCPRRTYPPRRTAGHRRTGFLISRTHDTDASHIGISAALAPTKRP